MNQHEKLNYVEFAAKDLLATKAFFTQVFAWDFVDYGPEYTAFSNQGLDGGFYKADLQSHSDNGGAMKGATMPITTSVSVPPVKNRTDVMTEIGTRLAKYISILLPRLTTRAETTAMTQEAMKT